MVRISPALAIFVLAFNIHAQEIHAPEPQKKEQVSVLRRIAAQALEDVSQRVSTDNIAKLAPYKDDPETTKELLISILEDRIASLSSIYAEEKRLIGPEGFQLMISIKRSILERGIRRIKNWKPWWTQKDIEQMFLAKADGI